MSALTFELRTKPDQRLDLSPLTPAALAGLKPKDIQALAIGTTREAVTVCDAFKLKGTDVASSAPTQDATRSGRGLRRVRSSSTAMPAPISAPSCAQAESR